MADLVYRFRPSILRREETYRLGSTTLLRSAGGIETTIRFSEILSIRIYGAPGFRTGIGTVGSDFERCVIRRRRGRALALSSSHLVALGRSEDRADSFRPFIDALVARVAAANPATVFRAGMPPALWACWLAILVAVVVVGPLALILILAALATGAHIESPLILTTVLLLGVLCSFRSYSRTVRRNRPRPFDPRTAGGASPRFIEETRG
jgi:hypothetical protein